MSNQLNGWFSMAEGADESELAEAPIECDEWEQRPWIRVRPLTDGEAFERESLGVIEEYDIESNELGDTAMVCRRYYDLRAMAEYDYQHCIVDFLLPEKHPDGCITLRRANSADPAGNAAFLAHMQPQLSAWVWSIIERINHRQPSQRAAIEGAKKKYSPQDMKE